MSLARRQSLRRRCARLHQPQGTRFIIRILIVTLVAIAAWCGAIVRPASAATPHVLAWADGLDVSSLNPFIATTGNINPLAELTAAEFVRFDAAGNPIPDLVTVIPTKANHGISADGRTITWHLRHGVRWSDGAPFDASDVTYTVRAASDPRNNIAVRDPWTRLRGVDAPDPYTVVLHFKAPYALFLEDYFSTLSSGCILPKHILGPGTLINDAPYNALPVGIGPFRFTAYDRGDRVEMEANPFYWRGKPKLQKIVYKIIPDVNTLLTQLETGELDLGDALEGTVALRAKALPGKANVSRLSPYMTGLFFNLAHGAVADRAVREALSLATNRQLILDKVSLGIGVLAESVVPLTSVDALRLPVPRYDPARAATLLDAAGWKRGSNGMRAKNGVPLAVDFAIPAGYAPSATLAAVMHDAWGAIGVAVTIRTWSDAQFFAPFSESGVIQTGKFDVANFAQSLGPIYANVNGVYDCASIPPNGYNVFRYCNRTVDALNDRYLQSFEPAARAALAHDFQRRIDADLPAVILYERTFLAVYDAHLRGYRPNRFSYWGDPLQLDI
jgi:peptide/nickel transport system substrate-binding protein